MVTRREVGSWLEPRGASPGEPGAYPGSRLGRPEDGPGSLGGFGRRVAALAIDWVISLFIAGGFLRGAHLGQFAPLLVLLVMNVLLVGTAGSTIGQRLLALRVETLDSRRPGLLKALVRSVLLCLAVPPLVWDADQRGLHDRFAGTVLARA